MVKLPLPPSPQNFHKTPVFSPMHKILDRSNPLQTAGQSPRFSNARDRHAPALKSWTAFTAPHHCTDSLARRCCSDAPPHRISLNPVQYVGVFDHHCRMVSEDASPGPFSCPGKNAMSEI